MDGQKKLNHTANAPVCVQVGYQITVVKFFLFFALNFELLLISETLGILCAGLHRNELVGMIILATFYVPLLMFTGFIQVGPSTWHPVKALKYRIQI
jgi:ATP-binding cassette subfamily G (WHITE) protein 2